MSMRQFTITKSITNRDSLSLEKYLQEIKKVELITPEEEVNLAGMIKLGDKKALDRLTKANLRFVVSVAKQYQNKGLSLPDLINEGNLGLIKAAQRYDATKGFKFISYAIWWIRQSILHGIAENGRLVRLPVNIVGFSHRIQKVYNRLEQEIEREPSAEELADALNIDMKDLALGLSYNGVHLSLDKPVSDSQENTMLDILENPNSEKTDAKLEHFQSLKTEIQRSLKVLNEQQRNILCDFFGINLEHPKCLEEIGIKYSLSRERIRQIKDKALMILRTKQNTGLLRDYMGK